MGQTYDQPVHRYALFLAFCTFVLIIAGALVTSNEAALSVPTWPGPVMPPMVGGIRYEHSHRIIAATVGLLTIVLAVLLWRREDRNWMRWLGAAALGTVVAQGVLGGLTVLLNLHYGISVVHACLAEIFFGLIVSIALFTSQWWRGDVPKLEDRGWPSVGTLAVLNAAVIFLQVIFGAAFRHKDISIVPHLLGAVAVTATVTWTAAALRRRFSSARELSVARILLHSIFGTQFLLGIGAWWSRLSTADAPQPMPVMVTLTVAHTVVGALTFACAVLVVLLCRRLVQRSREEAAYDRRPEGAALS